MTTALGLAIVGKTTGRAQTSQVTPHGGSLAGPTLAQPLIGGQKIAVADASSAAGFQVPLPNTPVANQGNLTATWVVSGQSQVALVFDGGKVTIMMAPATYQDPLTEFKTYIAENNVTANIGQVNGQPALVITPGTDAPKSNPAWLEVDLNGIDVNVVSATYGTDQLLAVADSLH